jgi:hypothetical protein
MFRVIGVTLLVLVVIAITYLSFALSGDSRMRRAFAQVKIGDQRDAVDLLLGKPFTVLHAGEEYQGEVWPGPWSEARLYANPLMSPNFSERVVFFDAKGVVLSTATIGSP